MRFAHNAGIIEQNRLGLNLLNGVRDPSKLLDLDEVLTHQDAFGQQTLRARTQSGVASITITPFADSGLQFRRRPSVPSWRKEQVSR